MQKNRKRAKPTEGLRSLAGRVRRAGTHGDTILAHINPAEARLLDYLADRKVDYPVNKKTGLPAFGMSDSEAGGYGGHGADTDSNPGGVGGGPAGGQTGGGLGGNTDSGQGGRDGGYGDLPDRAVAESRGFIGNPEMGGGWARSQGLATVGALGSYGRNVNAASAVAQGRSPSFADRVADFTGSGAPGGFARSAAANLGVGLVGGLVAGPVGSQLASLAHDVGVRGKSAPEAIGSTVGGMLGGGLGSLAGGALGQQISGRESYASPMTQADRDAKDQARAEAGRTGSTPAGADTGRGEGAGAGTEYLMPAPRPTAPSSEPAVAQRSDGWDEEGFLTRHPEVAKAVSNGIWTDGRSFNQAFRANTGASYDAAKALGVVTPYTDDTLKTRPGQAVAYRG